MGQLILRFELALRVCSLIIFHACAIEIFAEALFSFAITRHGLRLAQLMGSLSRAGTTLVNKWCVRNIVRSVPSRSFVSEEAIIMLCQGRGAPTHANTVYVSKSKTVFVIFGLWSHSVNNVSGSIACPFIPSLFYDAKWETDADKTTRRPILRLMFTIQTKHSACLLKFTRTSTCILNPNVQQVFAQEPCLAAANLSRAQFCQILFPALESEVVSASHFQRDLVVKRRT